MNMLKYAVILMLGILLFGCVTPPNYNITNVTNYTVTNNTNVTNITNVQPGGLEFSLPPELPIAYVGTPYVYSFCNPQPTPMDPGSSEYVCGDNNVTSKNPTGGTPRYWITEESQTKWYIDGITYTGNGILNFTPKAGDEGQYVLQVCARDSGGNDRQEICKNTTIYIMSDTVTVKGEGELTHYLLLKLNSDVKAADFAGNAVEKNITTGYVRTTNFSFAKVTAEIPAALPSADSGAWQGGGSYVAQDVTATDTSVSVIADGNAACGKALGPDFPGNYEVDYYHVGYVGYVENTLIALSITNTGTKDKAIDVHLEASSLVDSRSQNYFGATADAVACIESPDHCVSVPTGARGAQMTNSTVFRVLVRPGSHRLYVGSMNDRSGNTNMITCPSFVKVSSKVSVTIVPADMSDGKKAIGSIYSYKDHYGVPGSGVK